MDGYKSIQRVAFGLFMLSAFAVAGLGISELWAKTGDKILEKALETGLILGGVSFLVIIATRLLGSRQSE